MSQSLDKEATNDSFTCLTLAQLIQTDMFWSICPACFCVTANDIRTHHSQINGFVRHTQLIMTTIIVFLHSDAVKLWKN